MSKPAGKCVFCGGPGLTKGHIWPEWLQQVLPLSAPAHYQIKGELVTFVPTYPRQPFSQITKQGHASARKPRNTCKGCNTGWMSMIEDAARPIATPLITTRRGVLDEAGQRLLATFLCLITIRIEFMDRETAGVPKADRVWLMKNMKPPPSWKIWIARYASSNPEDHWCRHHGLHILSSPDESSGPGKANTQATTLVMGKLCAHLFSSSVWSDFNGYTGVPLTQVWPIVTPTINWRRAAGLLDNSVISLSEALVRGLPPPLNK